MDTGGRREGGKELRGSGDRKEDKALALKKGDGKADSGWERGEREAKMSRKMGEVEATTDAEDATEPNNRTFLIYFRPPEIQKHDGRCSKRLALKDVGGCRDATEYLKQGRGPVLLPER